MRVKMSLEDVLKGKVLGGVTTVDAQEMMSSAVKTMAHNNFGALIVTSDGAPVGIVTERDVLRQAAEGAGFLARKVAEVMTRDIVVATLSDDIESIKRIMTEKRIRHIPVMEGGKLIGIVSIGDVVRSQLTTTQAEARYLRDYIAGAYA